MAEIRAIPRLAKRAPDGHKGDYGRVLVIAGSRGMAGAAALCGAAALRSGAGLVTVACPAEVQPTVAQFEPSYMTWPLPDANGRIAFPLACAHLDAFLHTATVVAAGPGLGMVPGLDPVTKQQTRLNKDFAKISSETLSLGLVAWLLEQVSVPLVLDADALNAIAQHGPERLRARKAPTVLTPHPGEFARLARVDSATVQSDRIKHATSFAASFDGACVLVLKGHKTIVTDGADWYENSSGNPGMATGGSGDCLTGVIAALLGQGMTPMDAAILGVYVHGLAGDIARDQNGEVGMIAGDLVDALPDAFYHLSEPC